LVDAVKKSVRPQLRVNPLSIPSAPGKQHAESRQVFVFTPQAVAQPGTHTRTIALLCARLHERQGRIVIDGFGVQRLNKAELISDAGDVRKEFADPRTRSAVSLKIEERSYEGKALLIGSHSGKSLAFANRIRQLRAMQLLQQRLVIEALQLRRRSVLTEINNTLCLRREVRHASDRLDVPFSISVK